MDWKRTLYLTLHLGNVPKSLPNSKKPSLLFKLLASDGVSDVPYMEVVTSVTSSAGLANTLEDLLCKCLVEGVQCSKLFQDFTRGICYIRPWMERRGVP